MQINKIKINENWSLTRAHRRSDDVVDDFSIRFSHNFSNQFRIVAIWVKFAFIVYWYGFYKSHTGKKSEKNAKEEKKKIIFILEHAFEQCYSFSCVHFCWVSLNKTHKFRFVWWFLQCDRSKQSDSFFFIIFIRIKWMKTVFSLLKPSRDAIRHRNEILSVFRFRFFFFVYENQILIKLNISSSSCILGPGTDSFFRSFFFRISRIGL